MQEILFVLIGYLSGSVLFARVSARLLHRGDVSQESQDKNPGTTNAFRYGGFACGVLTLLGDILKGALPIWLYLAAAPQWAAGLAVVLPAPVLGHIFPLFFHFRGGKGIATTFGCLLGLLPDIRPALLLAASFLFFSLIVRVSPHYYRTIAAYLCTEVLCLFFLDNGFITLGFTAITLAVGFRFLRSEEPREDFKVGVLWKR